MKDPEEDLEARFRPLSVVAVLIFSASLALGLILYLIAPENRLALLALHGGLLILIASPAIRISVAAAERIRRRDWPFVLMTLVIVTELMVVLWRAVVTQN
jgi:uncharacterized membrane protein